MPFTLGIDYGTNSVRALVVDTADGRELGSAVAEYPGGKHGILLDPLDHNLARQHPGDYLWGLEKSVRAALEQAGRQPGFSADGIIGIGVDTTGSSPIPVDKKTSRWRSIPGGTTTLPRNAGCGRTTRATARPRASPNSPRSTARSTSPSAATPIRPSGSGARFGDA